MTPKPLRIVAPATGIGCGKHRGCGGDTDVTSAWEDWVHMGPKLEETQEKHNGQSWGLGLSWPISEAGHSQPPASLDGARALLWTLKGEHITSVLASESSSLVGLKDATQKSLTEIPTSRREA